MVVPPTVIAGKSLAMRTEGVGDGWCVDYVQEHGFSQYSGNAGTWKRYINVTKPSPGDVVVLKEGSIGHVAIVQSVASKSLTLIEQNFIGKYIVSTRTIPKDYARIVGFISPPVASSTQDLLPR